jgi:hypothetical protein
MNAVAKDVLPSALDRLRAHRATVARVHDAMAQFNGLTGEHSQLGGTVALIEAAINAAKATHWPDPQEIARLLVEQDGARTALDRFTRKHRDALERAAQLNRDLVALASQGAELTAAALVEHAMGAGVESFADVADLYVAGVVEWSACWLAVERAHGRMDAASTGISPFVRLPVPINAPKSAALEALRLPRDLTARIEQRARELLAEIQAA